MGRVPDSSLRAWPCRALWHWLRRDGVVDADLSGCRCPQAANIGTVIDDGLGPVPAADRFLRDERFGRRDGAAASGPGWRLARPGLPDHRGTVCGWCGRYMRSAPSRHCAISSGARASGCTASRSSATRTRTCNRASYGGGSSTTPTCANHRIRTLSRSYLSVLNLRQGIGGAGVTFEFAAAAGNSRSSPLATREYCPGHERLVEHCAPIWRSACRCSGGIRWISSIPAGPVCQDGSGVA